MRINRKIVFTVLWSFSAAGLLVLLGFTDHHRSTMPCSGLEVKVVDNTGHLFIEPTDILELLNTRGTKMRGMPMGEVDLGLLERLVYTNPYVDRAEVYAGMNGRVHIDVWQRNPVMRVINAANEHFYVDEKGVYFPRSDKYSANVIVASGTIIDRLSGGTVKNASPYPNDTLESPLMEQLNELAWYLKNNKFWDAQFEQVYVNDNYELELIPRVGDQAIIIGNSTDLEKKMDKLLVFYREGLTRKGWEKYDVINLKYRDQVVCTKADHFSVNTNR